MDNTLSLSIFNRTFEFAHTPELEESLRVAAQHVDNKMKAAHKAHPSTAPERLAIFVALELCQDLIRANKILQQQQGATRLIQQMIEETQQEVEHHQKLAEQRTLKPVTSEQRTREQPATGIPK